MKLCFVVEDCYRDDVMPLAVARRLAEWGHDVEVLEPVAVTSRVSELFREDPHDAWVLKSVSDGPGLSLLEAAAAAGHTTVNDARSIRPVRDKAVAAAIARRHGIPFPLTYFAVVPALLRTIPAEYYPLVVKPANGSSGRAVTLVRGPEELLDLRSGSGWLLAQPYVANPGVDIKVYNTGDELHATVQPSPLHPDVRPRARRVRLPDDLAHLVRHVGEVFGLDLYGVDVVEGADGWTVVDVNDFPSFSHVPKAVAKVAATVVRLAACRRPGRREPAGRIREVTPHLVLVGPPSDGALARPREEAG
jgi:ribosomal protein S6--L-glutamate ligase